MTVLIPPPTPPTRPAHPASDWNPLAPVARGGGDYIKIDSSYMSFEVLGRAGAKASDVNIDAVQTVLWNDPTMAALGSWITMHWESYIGRGAGLREAPPFILFEFRTQAEVEEAAQGGHGFIPFAVTYFEQDLSAPSAHLPACDGLDPYGDPYEQSSWGDTPFVRILIREDLLLGGAGEEWSGRPFLCETVCHELGHVVIYLLMKAYGVAWVKEKACAIFGRPLGEWDAGAWEDRVQEAVAETYKDVMMPKRAYDNRTNIKLAEGSFTDFKTLFVDLAEDIYFENADNHPLQLRSGGAWAGNGYIVTDQPGFAFTPPYQPSYLFTTPARWAELQALGPLAGSVSQNHLLAWPHTQGSLRVHWNFNVVPHSPADFGLWPDFSPQTDARINLGFQFWTADAALAPGPGQIGNPGVLLGEVSVEVNPETNASGYGYVDLPFGALPFSPPADGMLVMFAPIGRTPWAHPYDGGSGSPNDEAPYLPRPDVQIWDPDTSTWMYGAPGQNAGADYVKPWMEALNLPKLRRPLRDLPWPYAGSVPLDSTLTVGQMDIGVVRMQVARVRSG